MTPKQRAEAFAELVTTHAIKAGYDLSSPRSGGKTKLAEDTGISPATIGRLFAGRTIPDAYSLQPLADAIGVPVTRLLEAAGIVSPGRLTGPDGYGPISVKQAAAGLGITRPLAVSVFEAVTATLLAGETT
ncbi:helix-turn-helix domain-containing protein [Streptomyces sp. ME18-1-4]|uniref:helix-turn-helix domain-containing protein n=1 Tax=Streptomyces sp. ME18-1-4 TaxID=3028685 RepID=UPI0029B59056|nr:helix-turn-helix domain-containing protein [Streptomyces sp. ME18-1-4]MDX3249487.1 helix-turn-helix domain-containing protein [Streptomyces sp. ME18-1-4]